MYEWGQTLLWGRVTLVESCHLLSSNKLFPTLLPAGQCHLGGGGVGVPCRLRPHHTSNLQNSFFPFNVGGGSAGRDRGQEKEAS